MNNYVLIDCGLIHQYLIKKEDIEKLEDETFYTVETVKDLSDYKIENKDDKLIFTKGSETLTFKKVAVDMYLKYALDEL
ncbi:hypothetical protein [Clostridium sp.]|uniref:hypothetical protein n=1 Tax=Clostridium sp. TaxID=1506 RepID=UPI001A36BBFE|nr:hypothetical protein [Clostridium sp.]MBK5235824.1 hypothetical protein [Clostridium sp.]